MESHSPQPEDKDKPNEDSMPVTPEQVKAEGTTRRDFLGRVAGVTLAAAGAKEVYDIYGKMVADPQNADKIIPTHNEEKGSYAETLTEQTLMILAKRFTAAVFDELGVPQGNKGFTMEDFEKRLAEKPLQTVIESCISTPATEEILFRLWPMLHFIKPQDTARRWDIGIPSAAIFALVHNLRKDEFDQYHFEKSIPITQFMGGLFYWYLLRERGLNDAMLAHMFNNTAYFSVGHFLHNKFPGTPTGPGPESMVG